jgi:spore maturation protein CgeB
MIATMQTARIAPLDIAFFGSSFLSAYWNSAATYYRGIIHALAQRGHRVTFYEPDAFDRQKHRDMDPPSWCRIVVYSPESEQRVLDVLERARGADVIVKASGVGIHDELLERAIPEVASAAATTIFWDVDAPATLARIENDPADPLAALVGKYDVVLTYGGGDLIVSRYMALGARACHPVYNALDPDTHHPLDPDSRFAGDLGFLGNRHADREARFDEFFIRAAWLLPDRQFLLGGNGWEDEPMPPNIRCFGHIHTRDHNAFNSTPLAMLNISREAMASSGYFPAKRLFEAAGAGACVITDDWEGIEQFLEPGRECLVARSADDVARHIRSMDMMKAATIGDLARRRILREHTYLNRAVEVEAILAGQVAPALRTGRTSIGALEGGLADLPARHAQTSTGATS